MTNLSGPCVDWTQFNLIQQRIEALEAHLPNQCYVCSLPEPAPDPLLEKSVGARQRVKVGKLYDAALKLGDVGLFLFRQQQPWLVRDPLSPAIWKHWESKGRINFGQDFTAASGVTRRIYPVAELEKRRDELLLLGTPYPDPDRPGCWRVPIKSFASHREAIIDAADLPLVAGQDWSWAPRHDGIGGYHVVRSADSTTRSRPPAPTTRPPASCLGLTPA